MHHCFHHVGTTGIHLLLEGCYIVLVLPVQHEHFYVLCYWGVESGLRFLCFRLCVYTLCLFKKAQ